LTNLTLRGDDPLYFFQTNLWLFTISLRVRMDKCLTLMGVAHFDRLFHVFLVFANTELML